MEQADGRRGTVPDVPGRRVRVRAALSARFTERPLGTRDARPCTIGKTAGAAIQRPARGFAQSENTHARVVEGGVAQDRDHCRGQEDGDWTKFYTSPEQIDN